MHFPKHTKYVQGYYDSVRHDALALLHGPVQNVLEIGCGAGSTIAYMKQQGIASYVVGVEINEEYLQIAKHSGVDLILNSNIEDEKLPFKNGFFDLILCLDVLEHMFDPWSALKNVLSLLSPEGTVIASIPNVQNIRVILPLIFGQWKYKESGILDNTHLRFFTKASAKYLLEESGFVIQELRHIIDKKPIIRAANALTLGIFRRFMTTQYLISGKRDDKYK